MLGLSYFRLAWRISRNSINRNALEAQADWVRWWVAVGTGQEMIPCRESSCSSGWTSLTEWTRRFTVTYSFITSCPSFPWLMSDLSDSSFLTPVIQIPAWLFERGLSVYRIEQVIMRLAPILEYADGTNIVLCGQLGDLLGYSGRSISYTSASCLAG